jgi:DNA repair protein RadC
MRSRVRVVRKAPCNYTVEVVEFRMVREPGHTDRVPLSSPDLAAAVAGGLIPEDGREHFWCLYLDAQNRLVTPWQVSVGTLCASLVRPPEVFGPAVRLMGVASLILVHNHPSGDATPSPEDLRLTRDLAEVGRLHDIRVHDHIILGAGARPYVSLAETGVL